MRARRKVKGMKMLDNFNEHAPHLHDDDLEPDGAMEMAAYAILITLALAILLVAWLCL